MKVSSTLAWCVVTAMSGLMVGCASKAPKSAAAPAPEKKGHWVSVPAQTGSYIPRRVWVDDTGQTTGSTGVNNVQNGSAADIQRIQSTQSGFRPPGG